MELVEDGDEEVVVLPHDACASRFNAGRQLTQAAIQLTHPMGRTVGSNFVPLFFPFPGVEFGVGLPGGGDRDADRRLSTLSSVISSSSSSTYVCDDLGRLLKLPFTIAAAWSFSNTAAGSFFPRRGSFTGVFFADRVTRELEATGSSSSVDRYPDLALATALVLARFRLGFGFGAGSGSPSRKRSPSSFGLSRDGSLAGRDCRARFAFGLELKGAEGVEVRGAARFFAPLRALAGSASFRASAVGRRARFGIASGVDWRDASDSASDSESDGAGDVNGESPSFLRGVALGALALPGFRERLGVGSGLDNGDERFLPFFTGVSSLAALALDTVPRRALGAGAFLGVTSGVLKGESSRARAGRGRLE